MQHSVLTAPLTECKMKQRIEGGDDKKGSTNVLFVINNKLISSCAVNSLVYLSRIILSVSILLSGMLETKQHMLSLG